MFTRCIAPKRPRDSLSWCACVYVCAYVCVCAREKRTNLRFCIFVLRRKEGRKSSQTLIIMPRHNQQQARCQLRLVFAQAVALYLVLLLADRPVTAAVADSSAPQQQQQQAVQLPPAQPIISDADYAGPNGGGGGTDECDPDMVGFELVTGYVYSAPKNLIESIPGSLMLTECLETCQANDSCQAVNYETGLCVLFSSNADSNPGESPSLSIFYFYIYIYKHMYGEAIAIRLLPPRYVQCRLR